MHHSVFFVPALLGSLDHVTLLQTATAASQGRVTIVNNFRTTCSTLGRHDIG
jgi:hypothetical protein